MGPNATPTLRVSSRRFFPSQLGPATYWRESGERRESRRPAPPSGVGVATSEDDENHDAIDKPVSEAVLVRGADEANPQEAKLSTDVAPDGTQSLV
ncbi:hypothetical protein CMUS01_13111 [Colletotrichum musicola]|uniref:Uncharacterized protein n=1 Tax=Colletotrichum musicola TaxID=2175873 RepID=A0A8H6MX32_9PEZI|nr:hypothetical protein CMUS01_13111 [Colletotrichum musicola]